MSFEGAARSRVAWRVPFVPKTDRVTEGAPATMPKRFSVAVCVAAFLGLSGAASADESAYLGKFEGGWTGSGQVRLMAGAPMVSVSCNLAGTAAGQKLELKGKCSGGLVSTQVNATMEYDPATGAYIGSWKTSGTNAGLAGKRLGNRMSLSVRESGEPGRRLTLSIQGSRLHFTMQRTDDKAKVLQLALNKS